MRRWLVEHGLLLVNLVLFVGFLVGMAVTGYSEEQQLHGSPTVTPFEYLGTSQFWFESFQNWQSEFMVVAVLVGASVWLRQRGSGESKPVAAPHSANS